MRPSTSNPLPLALLSCLSLVVLLFLIAPSPAVACGGGGCFCSSAGCSATFPCGDPCPCGGAKASAQKPQEVHLGETIISPLSPSRAQLRISGMMSLGMLAADSCQAALGNIPGIQQVRSVQAFDGLSGALMKQLPMEFNAATGPSFASEAAALYDTRDLADWQGFEGDVQSDVPKGKLLTFVLDVDLKPGVSFATLAEQLRQGGLLGTGKANTDGTVNDEHVHFRFLNDTPVVIAPRLTRPVDIRPEDRLRQ